MKRWLSAQHRLIAKSTVLSEETSATLRVAVSILLVSRPDSCREGHMTLDPWGSILSRRAWVLEAALGWFEATPALCPLGGSTSTTGAARRGCLVAAANEVAGIPIQVKHDRNDCRDSGWELVLGPDGHRYGDRHASDLLIRRSQTLDGLSKLCSTGIRLRVGRPRL